MKTYNGNDNYTPTLGRFMTSIEVEDTIVLYPDHYIDGRSLLKIDVAGEEVCGVEDASMEFVLTNNDGEYEIQAFLILKHIDEYLQYYLWHPYYTTKLIPPHLPEELKKKMRKKLIELEMESKLDLAA